MTEEKLPYLGKTGGSFISRLIATMHKYNRHIGGTLNASSDNYLRQKQTLRSGATDQKSAFVQYLTTQTKLRRKRNNMVFTERMNFVPLFTGGSHALCSHSPAL